MKTLIFALFMLFTSMSSTATATNDLLEESEVFVRKEVSKFLKYHYLELTEEVVVYVKLKVNKHNRIEVLEIDSEDKQVKEYIHRSLNNKKIKTGAEDELQTYNLPVRLKLPL